MKEPQNKERIWSSVCGEGGCNARQYQFNSLLGVLHDGGFLAWLNPYLRQGRQSLAVDLADKESCSALGSEGGPESSGRILGLLFSKIKNHSMWVIWSSVIKVCIQVILRIMMGLLTGGRLSAFAELIYLDRSHSILCSSLWRFSLQTLEHPQNCKDHKDSFLLSM